MRPTIFFFFFCTYLFLFVFINLKKYIIKKNIVGFVSKLSILMKKPVTRFNYEHNKFLAAQPLCSPIKTIRNKFLKIP